MHSSRLVSQQVMNLHTERREASGATHLKLFPAFVDEDIHHLRRGDI